MATQAVYFKEHEGHGQLSAGSPWWGTALGSQQVYGESCGQSKFFTMELPNSGDQLMATKQPGRGTEQALDKGKIMGKTKFPLPSYTFQALDNDTISIEV